MSCVTCFQIWLLLTLTLIVLVALLLRQYVVFVLDYEVHVLREIFVEAMELRRELVWYFQLLLQEFRYIVTLWGAGTVISFLLVEWRGLSVVCVANVFILTGIITIDCGCFLVLLLLTSTILSLCDRSLSLCPLTICVLITELLSTFKCHIILIFLTWIITLTWLIHIFGKLLLAMTYTLFQLFLIVRISLLIRYGIFQRK